MRLRKQDKFNKILSIILVVLWCLLIFYLSNQKGSISEASSDSLVEFLNNIGINFPYMSLIIRKIAHMILYFVLYFLVYYLMFQFNIKKREYLSLLFCFLYSVSDEVHQLFIINRSGEVKDIIIDTISSSLAFIVLKIKSSCKS